MAAIDIEKFRANPLRSHPRSSVHAEKAKQPYIRTIPLSWIRELIKLPRAAITIGLVLWYRKGVERTNMIELTPKKLKSFGIVRFTAYKGLKDLQSAGLVLVDRRRGRSPRVKILDVGSLVGD